MRPKREIPAGYKFGDFTIISAAPSRYVGNQFRSTFLVKCEHKNEHIMELDSLREGVRCKCQRNKNFPWYIIDGLAANLITVEQAMKLTNTTYEEVLNLKKENDE